MMKTDLTKKNEEKVPLFRKVNYIIMTVGIVILALGYLLLVGGKSPDPAEFNPEIFNSTRMVIAPVLIVMGLLIEIVAIMYHPRKKHNTTV